MPPGRLSFEPVIPYHGLMFRRLWKETDGQNLVESALLAGFMAVLSTASVPRLAASVLTIYEKLNKYLNAAAQ